MSHFVAVGWDKRLRIWQDDRACEDENIKASRDLPNRDLTTNTAQLAHGDDIMSAIYDIKNNLVFTGGHDGTLLAWHFETGFIKFYLHEMDSTCCSKNYIKEAKSVDTLAIMTKKSILLSGSADQMIRFWDLNDLSSGRQPIFKMMANHMEGDALTMIAVNQDCDRLVTADTKGRLKLWDTSLPDYRKDSDPLSKMRVLWFIQAHKSLITSLQIVETFKDEPGSDLFVLSAGGDCNVLLHRLSNGCKVGQFGQTNWNIYDMSTCYRKRPNYVRDWFIQRKAEWKKFIEGKIKEAKAKGLLEIVGGEEFKLKTADKETLKKIGLVGSDGEGSFEDPNSEDGKDVDFLAYSSDEENASDKFKNTPLGGPTISTQQSVTHARVKPSVDESKYFASVLKHQPDKER